MRGVVIAEQGHVVNALPPVDLNGGKNSDVWSMSKAGHASIYISLGVTGAASTVTLHACDDFVPTATEAIEFAVYKCETAASDVTGERVEVTTSGFATTTADNVFYIIEVDSADLPEGKKNLQVRFSNPGAATLGQVGVVLTGLRYASTPTPTAIA